MALTIRPKSNGTVPIEAEVLRPDLCADKTADQIRQLTVQHGNRARPLGECFEIEGDPRDEQLVLEGDFSRTKQIGQSMQRGRITVHGPAGMHLGAEMRDGEIDVQGDAGDWVGAEMRGGLIRIHGSAGHLVGGSYRGSASGMKGGTIVVHGDAGNELGCGMRRGVIAVTGNVGDFAGFNLIAGTIVVAGGFGIRCGAGMRRGSIVSIGTDRQHPELLSTFRFDCEYDPQFLAIYLRYLRASGFNPDHAGLNGRYRRYSGDLVALGKGEILLRDSS